MGSLPPESPSATVITIDGPAGAGKSTVAKTLAQRLGFSYLDTGAMYRALTLKALRLKIPLEDPQALVALASTTIIDFRVEPDKTMTILLDGQDVSREIRSFEVTNNTFYIARTPAIRELMVEWQRAIGSRRDSVVEGRDTGTVVFPYATKKFYLDADFEERVERRVKELASKGQAVDASALKKDLQERDQKDFSRQVGPLKKAEDAIVINSTAMSVEAVVEKILSHIKR